MDTNVKYNSGNCFDWILWKEIFVRLSYEGIIFSWLFSTAFSIWNWNRNGSTTHEDSWETVMREPFVRCQMTFRYIPHSQQQILNEVTVHMRGRGMWKQITEQLVTFERSSQATVLLLSSGFLNTTPTLILLLCQFNAIELPKVNFYFNVILPSSWPFRW